MFIDQKAKASTPVRHFSCIVSTRRLRSVRTDTEHSVHPEERCVCMNSSRVEALHVVEGDRRVDQEPEQPSSNQIPETPRRQRNRWAIYSCGPMTSVAPWTSSHNLHNRS